MVGVSLASGRMIDVRSCRAFDDLIVFSSRSFDRLIRRNVGRCLLVDGQTLRCPVRNTLHVRVLLMLVRPVHRRVRPCHTVQTRWMRVFLPLGRHFDFVILRCTHLMCRHFRLGQLLVPLLAF